MATRVEVTAIFQGRKRPLISALALTPVPPTFVFFVNDPRVFTDDYKLYLERQLRKAIGFPGTPIRLLWRGKPGLSKAERLSGGR